MPYCISVLSIDAVSEDTGSLFAVQGSRYYLADSSRIQHLLVCNLLVMCLSVFISVSLFLLLWSYGTFVACFFLDSWVYAVLSNISFNCCSLFHAQDLNLVNVRSESPLRDSGMNLRSISGKDQHWPLSKNMLRHSYSANTRHYPGTVTTPLCFALCFYYS